MESGGGGGWGHMTLYEKQGPLGRIVRGVYTGDEFEFEFVPN